MHVRQLANAVSGVQEGQVNSVSEVAEAASHVATLSDPVAFGAQLRRGLMDMRARISRIEVGSSDQGGKQCHCCRRRGRVKAEGVTDQLTEEDHERSVIYFSSTQYRNSGGGRRRCMWCVLYNHESDCMMAQVARE